MLQRRIALLIIFALSAAFFHGCAKEASVITPGPASSFFRTGIYEKYIDVTPRPKRTPVPRPYTQIDAYSSTVWSTPDTSSDPVEPGEQDGTHVLLEEVVLAEQTLYRMGNTDYLISAPATESANTKTALINMADMLLGLQKKYPSIKFYTYFINRAYNCDWYAETNGIKVYDYAGFFSGLVAKDGKIKAGAYQLKDFNDYMDTGYKTDFHVNYKGSYRVYQDVYNMMKNDLQLSIMLQPLRELDFSSLKMLGDLIAPDTAKKVTFSDEEMDDFKAYIFDYGPHTSYINEVEMELGMEKEYEAGDILRDPRAGHQFIFYGGQTGLIRLEFNKPDKPNLLMLSDSQGRPSRKLLAHHFNRTIYLDDVQSRKMDLGEVIRENDIDVVLLIGQQSMFELYK